MIALFFLTALDWLRENTIPNKAAKRKFREKHIFLDLIYVATVEESLE
jgi:hypothetical protein